MQLLKIHKFITIIIIIMADRKRVNFAKSFCFITFVKQIVFNLILNVDMYIFYTEKLL